MTITTTRTDCTRDNIAVRLPNAASTLGFGKWKAKRGDWIRYEVGDNHHFCGRVISRVTCEGQTYIEIAGASGSFSSAYVHWIKPAQVRECRKAPPKTVFDFFAGDWRDIEAIHARLADLNDQMPREESAS